MHRSNFSFNTWCLNFDVKRLRKTFKVCSEIIVIVWYIFFLLFFLSETLVHFSCHHLKKSNYGYLSRTIRWKKQAQACNFIKKETLAQVFSSEVCEIFKNSFFIEHLWWLLLYWWPWKLPLGTWSSNSSLQLYKNEFSYCVSQSLREN